MSNPLPSFVEEALSKADRKRIELAGIGCFAHVIKVADTGFVIKESFDHPFVGNLQPIEKRIYERLGHHPFILRYFGEYCQGNGLPNGLVFQYQRAGTLVDNLALSNYPEKRIELRLSLEARFIVTDTLQMAAASRRSSTIYLRYIHSKNVIHSDIGSHNFLIQEDGTLVLADFGGSMIDETSAVVSYSTRYTRPYPITDNSDSIKIDDLFALGTIIYEITVGHQLYPDQSSKEIRKLLRQHEFPDLENIAANVRAVIQKCWANEYHIAEEVLYDLNVTSPTRRPLLYFAGLSLGMAMIMYAMIRRRL